ncbi:dual specificity protein phosphatase MPK-4 [Bradysia coprophila]|uniref:dual specificity protein phosphatase MPK-4 n=1 Tax=Bradysia coprophila TaxID=38358 RepID=UPI00187DC238|nr:dual specificity protein phosphatase MPK-4 [Bradysia coprophila]
MAQQEHCDSRQNPKKATTSHLSREDFDGGPVSIDQIEKGLYLGNVTAATDKGSLQAHDITHILTVDSCPLPSHVLQISTLTNKYIQVSDVAKEDLLSHFDDCIEFIENSLLNNKRVLVHCYFGVSRSAAVVIAYIMRKYKISFSPAFERVKSKRRFVGPNPGFVQQLRLFYKMKWTIDIHHEQYKTYRLRLAADKVRKAKILPQSCMDLVKQDPGLIQTNPEPIVYRCKKCRRIVASKSNVITHKPVSPNQRPRECAKLDAYADEHTGVMIDEISDKLKENSLSSDRSSDVEMDYCKDVYFIEPLAWMDGILRQTNGKLHCPKCQSKLGSFSWTMGINCPCGTQVSPAFYLVPSKVELSRSVQNVQITV